MKYLELNGTGKKASILGFGAMRLPYIYKEGKEYLQQEEVSQLVKECFESGVNVFDTAHTYNYGESEKAIGKALKDYPRRGYVLSTKLSIGQYSSGSAFEEALKKSLERLGQGYLDILYLHDLRCDAWRDWCGDKNNVRLLTDMKKNGSIGALYFSSHDTPENVEKLMQEEPFDGVLLQYNILDRKYEGCFKQAKSKGLATLVMGPLAGGQIVGNAEEWNGLLVDANCENVAELGFNFVKSNGNIDVILSGMCTTNSIKKNARYLCSDHLLTNQHRLKIGEIQIKLEKKDGIYCTWCKYCHPCPADLNIPLNIKVYKMYKVFKSESSARRILDRMGKDPLLPGNKYSECVQCGKCEERCPQGLDIMKMMREMKSIFG
jgi:uncharacterized protein